MVSREKREAATRQGNNPYFLTHRVRYYPLNYLEYFSHATRSQKGIIGGGKLRKEWNMNAAALLHITQENSYMWK